MNYRFASPLILLLAAACATSPEPTASTRPATSPPDASAAFRTSDFAWSQAPGKGQIDGQLTYKAGNVAFSCAAAGVVLTPETPWVRSRMVVLYTSAEGAALPAEEVRRRTPPERSQDYSSFVRRAPCDATGKFTFRDLPDGAWFVITVARPADPAAARDMALMRRVVVAKGRVVKMRL